MPVISHARKSRDRAVALELIYGLQALKILAFGCSLSLSENWYRLLGQSRVTLGRIFGFLSRLAFAASCVSPRAIVLSSAFEDSLRTFLAGQGCRRICSRKSILLSSNILRFVSWLIHLLSWLRLVSTTGLVPALPVLILFLLPNGISNLTCSTMS